MGWLWPLVAGLFLFCVTAGFYFLGRRKTRDNIRIQFYLESLEKNSERLEGLIREEVERMRDTVVNNAFQTKTSVAGELKDFGNAVKKSVEDMIHFQRIHAETSTNQMNLFINNSEERIERIRETVDSRLEQIQNDNARNIEQVRLTVDEKLQGTLERRLGESFRQVSERLEQVHRGLGDMQNLASGVGDLKKIFANVKSRGMWGEIHLENLLVDILSPAQYEKNVRTKERSNEVVEFAVKLPGGEEGEMPVWLPVDSKFPLEDYQRLIDARERGETQDATEAARMLEVRLKRCARDIHDKYLNPPRTTDFAVMYLPSEGLYAETVSRADLIAAMQREYRVLVAGPSTFAALLNSLQIGFRTLAIQKRTSEVWQILSVVKTEFGKFGEILQGVKKKLEQATNNMDDALKKSRIIQRRLRDVQRIDGTDKGRAEDEIMDDHVDD
ncbi:MAG: DNA recombination protein RmuC [Syntrophales bacterium]|jgi:DNA recombination protein RmuC|nr:DNA recombination protein RmuC [Syntrophales bacterium]